MKKTKTFKLSDTALSFIKKYALHYLKITSKITSDDFDKIMEYASQCELGMVDDNGFDKDYDYPEKEECEMGDYFVTEVSGNYANEVEVDLDDLNKRLGF